MTYKQLKRKLKLTDADVADMFGFASAAAFSNSSAKERYEKALLKFYEIVIKQL